MILVSDTVCVCMYVHCHSDTVWALHVRVWAQTCVGTIVCGHNRVRAQSCLGTIVSGHKRVWAQSCVAQSCGLNRVGSIMYGPNRGGTIRDSFHIVRKISYSKLLTSSTFFRFLLYIHRLNYLFHLSFSHFGLFSLFELFSNISKRRKNLQFHAEKFIFISYHIFFT